MRVKDKRDEQCLGMSKYMTLLNEIREKNKQLNVNVIYCIEHYGHAELIHVEYESYRELLLQVERYRIKGIKAYYVVCNR